MVLSKLGNQAVNHKIMVTYFPFYKDAHCLNKKSVEYILHQ